MDWPYTRSVFFLPYGLHISNISPTFVSSYDIALVDINYGNNKSSIDRSGILHFTGLAETTARLWHHAENIRVQ